MTGHVVQVRPVPRRLWPRRVLLIGARRPSIWNGRLARRGALAGLPVGALAAILVSLGWFRLSLTDALWSYAAGAAAGALVGLVLGALLGACAALARGLRRARPVDSPRRLWVRHQADGPVSPLR